jgi:hypothetical protein
MIWSKKSYNPSDQEFVFNKMYHKNTTVGSTLASQPKESKTSRRLWIMIPMLQSEVILASHAADQ